MKRFSIVAVIIASAITVGACIVPAWAYFTDTTTAKGGLPVSVDKTEMREWYLVGQKHVIISNNDKSDRPVYVRARVYSSMEYEATGVNWSATPDADGWYNYDGVVKPGDAANELTVTITFPPVKSDEQPDGAVYGDNYNVIVYYESTPAIEIEGSETYEPPDWNNVEDSGTDEGGI